MGFVRASVLWLGMALTLTWALAWASAQGLRHRNNSQAGVNRELSARYTSMALIPSGTFVMGMDEDESEVDYLRSLCMKEMRNSGALLCGDLELLTKPAMPEREVFLSAYEIDRHEVTVRQYRACVRSGACDPSPLVFGDQRLQKDSLPLGNVTWRESQQFCQWTGKRLPTEAEWEKAARGPKGRRFPWGPTWEPKSSNHGRFGHEAERIYRPSLGQAVSYYLLVPQLYEADGADGHTYSAKPGSFPRGQSPYGVFDLAGNADEWVYDFFSPEGNSDLSLTDPKRSIAGRLSKERTVRGGSWLSGAIPELGYLRRGLDGGERRVQLGFRCARSP